MPNSFIKKVQQYAFHGGLLKRGDKIVVGVSGGPDSVALACVLNKLKEKQNFKIKLVHINYHQRGKDSDSDEKFVREFADKNKLDLEVFDYQKGKAKNLEEDMRNFRYNIFEKIRIKNNFDKIAIGHTKDDKVETFLMNLIRGTGTEGLVSLKKQRGKIIRPLMCCDKKEIINFLKLIKQDFCSDESNFDTSFSRNKIREELIPLLENDYNPKIKNRLIDLISHLEDDLDVLEDISEKVYNEKVVIDKSEAIIDLIDFFEMPIALQKRVFRRIIGDLVGDVKNVSMANFFEFKKIIKSDKSKISKMKIKGLMISRKAGKIYFHLIK